MLQIPAYEIFRMVRIETYLCQQFHMLGNEHLGYCSKFLGNNKDLNFNAFFENAKLIIAKRLEKVLFTEERCIKSSESKHIWSVFQYVRQWVPWLM